eukprot:CAMPEP_0194260902 /NCGR_PEP_ID=MMETSP0158-20130606/45748_1 /TAXON_ID=33649 /ORGANISM="Thalassionema nitzschioides, Strain L26-B" /LENGTH=891 /DNA_ID=CAMNT_0039001007 /DNA_START=62 /DNA_END=2738 /DNA_ORIENTATION=+
MRKEKQTTKAKFSGKLSLSGRISNHVDRFGSFKKVRISGRGVKWRANTNKGSTLAPNTLICYICGRGYGSKSLLIHEKQCAELFSKHEELLPVHERKGLPPRPDFETASSLNDRYDMAREAYENFVKESCPGCQRTFAGKDKLRKHMKGCDEAKKSATNSSGLRDCIVPGWSEATLKDGFVVIREGERSLFPKTYVCYICGREYGSTSIDIHEKQCLELFKKQQELLPPNERKDLPAKPAFEKASSREDRNRMARQVYESLIKETCPGCQRTFNGKEKLEKHMKGCEEAKKWEGSHKGIRECIIPAGERTYTDLLSNYFRGAEIKRINAPTTYICYVCGRQYGSKSIDIHEKQCLDIFRKQQACLPPKERKEEPVRPPYRASTTRLARNAMALEEHEKKVMESCPGCQRTFSGKDKLRKHMKGCDEAKALTTNSLGLRDCNTTGWYSKSLTAFREICTSKVCPTAHVCYLCGREYGSTSISIHEKQCLELFKKQQELLPPNQRKNVPLRPDFEKAMLELFKKQQELLPPNQRKNVPLRPDFEKISSLKERNKMAQLVYESLVKETCPGCYRRFNGKEKLDKHMKGCDLVKEMERDDITTGWCGKSLIAFKEIYHHKKVRPRAYICYLCGREYGSISISIHEQHCQELLKKQQKLLPPNERKDLPPKPAFESAPSLEERNRIAQQVYESAIKETCSGCQRTFNGKEKLNKHIKGCDAVKKINGSFPQKNKQRWKANLYVCYICGNYYSAKSITAHEMKCLEIVQRQQQLLPIEERKKNIPPPLALDAAKSRAERNKLAQRIHENFFMDSCPGCQRTFYGKDKLAKHMKGCAAVKKLASQNSPSAKRTSHRNRSALKLSQNAKLLMRTAVRTTTKGVARSLTNSANFLEKERK